MLPAHNLHGDKTAMSDEKNGATTTLSSIRIRCIRCGKEMAAKPELAGKKVSCPGCHTIFEVSADGGHNTARPPAPAKSSGTMEKVADIIKNALPDEAPPTADEVALAKKLVQARERLTEEVRSMGVKSNLPSSGSSVRQNQRQ